MSKDIETLKAIARIAIEALGVINEPLNSQPAAHSIFNNEFENLLKEYRMGIATPTAIAIYADTWAAGLLKEHSQHIELQRQTISSLNSANASLAARNIHSQNTILALTGSEGRAVRARDHLRRNYAELKQQLAEADQANSEAHAIAEQLQAELNNARQELRVTKAAVPGYSADPLNWLLPCDITVGSGTNKRGTPLRLLVARMQTLHEMATSGFSDKVAPAGHCERGRGCLCVGSTEYVKPNCGWWIKS